MRERLNWKYAARNFAYRVIREMENTDYEPVEITISAQRLREAGQYGGLVKIVYRGADEFTISSLDGKNFTEVEEPEALIWNRETASRRFADRRDEIRKVLEAHNGVSTSRPIKLVAGERKGKVQPFSYVFDVSG